MYEGEERNYLVIRPDNDPSRSIFELIADGKPVQYFKQLENGIFSIRSIPQLKHEHVWSVIDSIAWGRKGVQYPPETNEIRKHMMDAFRKSILQDILQLNGGYVRPDPSEIRSAKKSSEKQGQERGEGASQEKGNETGSSARPMPGAWPT